MQINISDNFNYKKLLTFTFPSIIMMIFTSLYIIVDGFFVSNFAGKTSLAAVNFAYPVVMVLGSLGFMFGTGGSALISKNMGEGRDAEANNTFSLVILTGVGLGIFLAIIGFALMEKIAIIMGARGELLTETVIYGRVLLTTLPFYILQYEFQCLCVTAGKPKMGLVVTVLAGLTNIVFDYLLIAVIPWGIFGGAVATSLSQVVGGAIPLIFFLRKNDSPLRIRKPKIKIKDLTKTCSNGSSEFMSNVSSSIISTLYNYQLLKLGGENGIAAYGVIMYIALFFQAIFIGYSVGVAPIIGYNYGKNDRVELKSVIKKSFTIVLLFSILMLFLSQILASPLSYIFVSYDKELMSFTTHAFKIFAYSFLFCGFSIFASSMFTALNNGVISALISFCRSLLFQSVLVITVPLILGLEGIWDANVIAEALAFIFSFSFVLAKRKKYGY